MSTIGKVFIILNLLLAGVFLGYAVHTLGKSQEFVASKNSEIAKLTTEKKGLEDEKSALVTKLNAESSAKEAARAEATANKEAADRNARDLETANTEKAKLGGDLTHISQTLEQYNTTIADRTKAADEASKAREAAEKARDAANHDKDAADKARRDAEDATRHAQEQIAKLEADLVTSKKNIDSLNTKLETVVKVTGVDLPKITAQPQIDGAVMGISYDIKPGLVTLNVGSDAGVSAGMTFEIYKGDKYKGQVRVEKALPNMCSALIIRPVQGQTIGQGDSASTRL